MRPTHEMPKELRVFILRGNVVDLAVAVVAARDRVSTTRPARFERAAFRSGGGRSIH